MHKTIWWVFEQTIDGETKRLFKSRNGTWLQQHCQRKNELEAIPHFIARHAYLGEDLTTVPTMGSTVIVIPTGKTAN